MIIACPECEGPFEVRDGDIAELVQLECPHCRFRMILDFAAANDSRLVETGMRMASGFRTAAEYRRAAGGPIRVAEPAAQPVPQPAEPPRPEVAPVAPAAERPAPPTTVPIAPPVSAAPPIAAAPAAGVPPTAVAATPPSVRTVATVPEEDEDDASETIVRSAPVGRSTVIGMVPPSPPPPAPRGPDAETEPARPRAEVFARAGVPEPIVEAPVPEPRPARPEPRPSPRAEAPSSKPTTTPAPEPRPRPAVREAPAEVPEPGDSLVVRRPSAFGTVLLVLLVLIVAALTVASVLRKNTPDPRPLLEDLYRQYL